MEAVLRPSTECRSWLDLPARTAVASHGVRIGFGAHSSAELDQLKSALPPGARTIQCKSVDVAYALSTAFGNSTPPGATDLVLAVDGDELVRSADTRYVFDTLERHLHLHVAEHAPHRVFVHAGVVGWNGRAVIIPGTTYAGKSTLVAALVDAGATYYSDEFAIVDRDGRVHPYLQPIQLRKPPGSLDLTVTTRLPMLKGKDPLRVGIVLVTTFRRGARWRPRPVSAGLGMLALLANTVSARRDPKRALQHLARLLDGTLVLKGTRGEAATVVQQLMRSGHLTQ